MCPPTFIYETGKPISLTQACARLRFKHLQFLTILGQRGNLRITADQVHITQPAATKMLMEIERILEARLFDRLPRGMRPTELGHFVLRYAVATLDGQRRFVEDFNALKRGGHGHLSIGAISGSAAQLLTMSVASILRQRPLLEIKLMEQSSDQLLSWLAERKIDLMIGRLTDELQRNQFHYEPLLGEPLHVAAGAHHSLRNAHELDLAELANWGWILYPSTTALRKISDSIFIKTGTTLTAGIVETTSFLFALELMQSSNMLSLQPAALVDKYVGNGLLARIPIELPVKLPDYGIITRMGEPIDVTTQAFIAELFSVANQMTVPF